MRTLFLRIASGMLLSLVLVSQASAAVAEWNYVDDLPICKSAPFAGPGFKEEINSTTDSDCALFNLEPGRTYTFAAYASDQPLTCNLYYRNATGEFVWVRGDEIAWDCRIRYAPPAGASTRIYGLTITGVPGASYDHSRYIVPAVML